MISSKKIGISIGSIIILALGVISFIVAPMFSDLGGGKAPDVIGKWKNTKIDTGRNSPFVAKYRYLKQYVDSQNMVPKDPQQQQFFDQQILRIAFNMSVLETAMSENLKSVGYTVPEFKVNKELVNYYLDENGYYSQSKYEQTPNAEKVRLQNSIAEYLKTNRYIEDLFGNGSVYGLKTSSKETDFIVNMAKKERSFKFVSFKSSSFPVTEVIKYGKEHEELFETYNLSLLTYQTEEETKKTLTSIKAGEFTFDDAVILNTTRTIADENGKLISNYRSDINKYFPDNENLKLILALKPEELSPVVSLHNGMFAIVRCDAEPSKPNFESEKTLTGIRNYINKNEKGLIEDYLLKEAKEFAAIAKKDSLEKTASSFKDIKLNVETSNSFGMNYGNTGFLQPLPSQGILYSIKENANFFKKAFSLKAGDISEPLLIGSEVLVLTLDEEKEIDQYTIDSTKTGYESQAGAWFDYYYAALIMRLQGLNYPLPVAQRTFMDFVLNHPQFKDNFSAILR